MLNRIQNAVRWRLGLPVFAAKLAKGTDAAVSEFYNSRVTECDGLADPAHYEWPRVDWVVAQVRGGNLLEVGCGDGGVTRLLSPRARAITALDVSGVSLRRLAERRLPNVTCVEGLVEGYRP